MVSVNVGLPREVAWKGRIVVTGIFKHPVADRVMLHALNLDGDRQADLTVHGGPSKAVYVYPSEHYANWREELPGVDLPWGMFGENLTTHGLSESEVSIGDRFRIGSAEVVVNGATHAMLQTRAEVRTGRHHQEVPGQPPNRILLCRLERRRSRNGR